MGGGVVLCNFVAFLYGVSSWQRRCLGLDVTLNELFLTHLLVNVTE